MLIDTDAGVFYTKLRGAAQAPSSLVAEIIVGALADALGLAVPARVLIDMPAEIGVDDPHWELAQLVRWSTGRNLGFQLLSNVRGFEQPDVARIEPELASRVVWLDGSSRIRPHGEEPEHDRSHGPAWLITWKVSLGFHHDWSLVTEDSLRRRGWASATTHRRRAPIVSPCREADHSAEVDAGVAALSRAAAAGRSDRADRRLDAGRADAAVLGVPVEATQKPAPLRARRRSRGSVISRRCLLSLRHASSSTRWCRAIPRSCSQCAAILKS